MSRTLLLALLHAKPDRRPLEAEVLGELRPQEAAIVLREPRRRVHEQRERGRPLPGLREVVDLWSFPERIARHLPALLHEREPVVQLARRDLARVLRDALRDVLGELREVQLL